MLTASLFKLHFWTPDFSGEKKKFTPKFFKIETNPSLENFSKVIQPFEYHDQTQQP